MEAIVISESVANSASSSASSMAQVTFIALDSMVLPTFMASDSMAQVTFIALDSMVLPTFMALDSMARTSNKAKERAARNGGELMPRLCRAASERAEEIKEATCRRACCGLRSASTREPTGQRRSQLRHD